KCSCRPLLLWSYGTAPYCLLASLTGAIWTSPSFLCSGRETRSHSWGFVFELLAAVSQKSLRSQRCSHMAVGEGFEPPVPFRVLWFSRPAPLTTRPSYPFYPHELWPLRVARKRNYLQVPMLNGKGLVCFFA